MTGCSECHSQDGFLFECGDCGAAFCDEHSDPADHDCPAAPDADDSVGEALDEAFGDELVQADETGSASVSDAADGSTADANSSPSGDGDDPLEDGDDSTSAGEDSPEAGDDSLEGGDDSPGDADDVLEAEGDSSTASDAEAAIALGPVESTTADSGRTEDAESDVTSERDSGATSAAIALGPRDPGSENDATESESASASGPEPSATGASSTQAVDRSADAPSAGSQPPGRGTEVVVDLLAHGVAHASALSETVVRELKPAGVSTTSSSSGEVSEPTEPKAADESGASTSPTPVGGHPAAGGGGSVTAGPTVDPAAASQPAPSDAESPVDAGDAAATESAGLAPVASSALDWARDLTAAALDRCRSGIRSGACSGVTRDAFDGVRGGVDRICSTAASVGGRLRTPAAGIGTSLRRQRVTAGRAARSAPARLVSDASTVASRTVGRARPVASATVARTPDLSSRTVGVLVLFAVMIALAVPFAGGLASSGLSLESSLDDGGGSAAGGSAAVTPSALNETDVERALYANLSDVRLDAGQSPGTDDKQLQRIAQYHSEDMAEREYVGPESPTGESVEDRFERFEYACQRMGQIQQQFPVAQFGADSSGDLEVDLARSIVDNWLQSEDHAEFLHSDAVNRFGVGVTVDDENSVVYVSLVSCGR